MCSRAALRVELVLLRAMVLSGLPSLPISCSRRRDPRGGEHAAKTRDGRANWSGDSIALPAESSEIGTLDHMVEMQWRDAFI